MKTDFLKGLGLTEEQITSIMAENGKDIGKEQSKAQQAMEKVTTELENSKLELKSKEELITSVNSEIEKFKGMNIEEIQKQVETLKTQNSEFEIKSKADKEAYEKQLLEKDYEFAVKEFTGSQKFTSEFTKNAFIEDFKKQGLKLDNGKFLGADDYIKGFQEKNQGVFVIEAPIDETPLPEFTTHNSGQTQETSGMFNFGFNPLRPMPKE